MTTPRFQQPLVSRPSYGSGQPAMPVAESGLPQGDPGGKGLSLDSDIPGTKTFAQPSDQPVRETNKAEPGSIYRVDNPDDMAKPQDDQEGDERDHSEFKPTFTGPGGRPKDDTSITKRPYRNNRPDKHMASVQTIVELYKLSFALESTILPQPGMTRTAARMDDLLEGLNPKVEERAEQCSVSVKRVDMANLRWIFAVNCGNGPKLVKVKGERVGNVVKFSKMDLQVKCSCPAWKWLGPEHNAQTGGYLDGKPRGTASAPDIKDPLRHNRTCKHVAAVLSHVRGWEIPKIKPKGK